MKFCMVTTFFGAHSFGGDAAYVDRLARALARRGHEVHVFHCADSFDAVATQPFDPAYMKKLFQLGYEMGRLGEPWTSAPP